MNKATRKAGVVAALGVIGALAGAAIAQATDNSTQAPAAQPLPPAPLPARWTPGPSRSSGMPSTRAGVPSRDGINVWRRVPRLSIDTGNTRRSPAINPVSPSSPAADNPGVVLIDRGGGEQSRRSWRRDAGGVSVSGSYADDHFQISASVSSAIANEAYRNWVGADNRVYASPYPLVGNINERNGCNAGSCWGWGNSQFWRRGSCPPDYISYWGYDPAWNRVYVGGTSGYFYGPDPALDVNYRPGVNPTSPPTAPAPPPTPDEIAKVAMSQGRYADAADALKLQLKNNPNDPAVMRRLGIAQLLARKWDDGFEQVARAYTTDPVLSDVPLSSEEVGVREDVLRELTGRVVTRARQGRSRDAWMTAAILMQSRDRSEQAITMLEAAKNAGMDASLYARMRQSLSR